MPSLSERLGANITTVHANSRIAAALARSGVSKTPELMRIVGLPKRVFDAATYPDASVLYAKSACGSKACQYCSKGDPRLLPLQSAMIIEAAQCSGGFFNVGVGGGKTLASMLMHDAMDAHKTVLLVPPQLRTKTLNIDYPILARHFKIPSLYGALGPFTKSGVYVVAYSELSDTHASDLLDKIKPDLIVADEAHALRHKDSARTRRFLRFMRKNPCKFVAMSGSMAKKSIVDWAHLVELALGKGSPLPCDYPSLVAWADAIDNEGEPGATEPGALTYFCEAQESIREAFSKRLSQTPGVILTTESAAGMPIELRLFTICPPASVLAAMGKLQSEWAWDGEEYTGALDIARLERQFTQGFFYRAIWPGKPDREWTAKRNAWQRAIRARLTHQNRQGQDSPALLEAMAERGEWTPLEWLEWCEVRHRDPPGREAVEVDKYLVNIASNWRDAGESGIIWIDSPVVGDWLQTTGIKYYGEGADDEVNALAEDCARKARLGLPGIPTIALSIRAHGTGKNLQAWARNLVLYPPASGDTWQQMIGRTHRPGQLADQVQVDVVLASDSALRAYEEAISNAKFTQQTMTEPHKLLLATECEPDDRLEELAF